MAERHVCATCAYWQRRDEFEGVCTEGLSGTIDSTEACWSCTLWTSLTEHMITSQIAQ